LTNRTQGLLTASIKWLVVLGFFTLPYTHLKLMPDLGNTRPVSAVFFALAFGLAMVGGLVSNRRGLKAWLQWPKSWDNWPILRWWVWLIVLGIISAAITPFYGVPIQAIIRLVGYLGIFTALFMAAYSLPRFGINRIANWILIGYLPVLAYAIVELLAILGSSGATRFILWFRMEFLIPFAWGNRISLLATEPSFVGFQMLLLLLLLPYVTRKWLKWCGWALVAICMVFTLSGTVIGIAAIYFGLWFLFSLGRRVLSRVALVLVGAGSVVLFSNWLIPQFQALVTRAASALFSIQRLQDMSISVQIRFNYILNLVYALVETRGIGLGIGQYGYFWREIYLRHINYKQFDIYGEVNRALTTNGDYMKPWSVILGVGVDLGVLGLVLLIGFFWQVYRELAEPRHRALFFACLAGLAGAYPIVTPHLWLALALMAGIGLEQKKQKEAQ